MVEQANPTRQAAQPPAAAANAPAATVAENKALRFTYSQLDAAHKNMADRLSALIVAYPDIIKLEDPKEQQDLIDRIVNSQSGREAQGALEGMSAQVKGIYEKLRKQDPSGVLNAGKRASDAAGRVGDFADGASKGLDVTLLPINISTATLGEMYNQSKVIWNGLDEKDARKIATAYASTMQAQQVDREQKGFFGTLTDSWGSAWAVIKALAASAGDMLAQIPFLKEPLAKMFGSNPDRTLADNFARQFAENDITTVRTEMQKLGTRDGIDFTAWGSALTTKSVLQNRAGLDQPVTPPSADSLVPALDGAQKDAKGNPVAAPTDTVDVLKDAVKKAGSAGKAEVDSVIGDKKWTPAEKAGAAVGTAYAADGLYGVAQGVARQVAGETRSGPAARATAATKEAEKFAEKALALREREANPRFWQNEAKLGEKAAAMEAKATSAAAEAAKHEAVQAARAGMVPKKATGFIATAEEAPKGHWLLRAGNYVGRFVGDGVGKAVSKTIDAMPWVAKAAPKVVKVGGVATLALGTTMAAADVVNGTIEQDAKKAADGKGALATIAGDAAIGAAAGAFLGGVGAVPGAIVGAGVGSLVVLAGEVFGFNGSGFKPYQETAQDVAAKQAYAQAKTQPQAFTQEELLAMNDGVKQQVQDMCSAKANKGVINFNLGTAFRSVDCTSIGSLSSSASAGTGGGRTVVAAQAAPSVAGS